MEKYHHFEFQCDNLVARYLLRDYFLQDISISLCWCQVINNSQVRTHGITCTDLKTLNSSTLEHNKITMTENYFYSKKSFKIFESCFSNLLVK